MIPHLGDEQIYTNRDESRLVGTTWLKSDKTNTNENKMKRPSAGWQIAFISN